MAVTKNQEYTVTVEGYSGEGAGVARIDGFVVFVSGALRGEVCRVLILKVLKSAAFAKVLEVLVPSPHRIAPDCPYFPRCGGCTYRHMDYAEELALKRRRVQDNLARIGGSEVEVEEILGAAETRRYHQACDLFLFSSKSETQGIVLLEAMAAYLPVFAIRATGVSDVVVNGENGVLSSDSITEWADNLISILKNPAVLIKMRSSARTTALLYDEKSIANQILESYAYLKKSYEAEHWLMMHLNRTSYPVLAKEY